MRNHHRVKRAQTRANKEMLRVIYCVVFAKKLSTKPQMIQNPKLQIKQEQLRLRQESAKLRPSEKCLTKRRKTPELVLKSFLTLINLPTHVQGLLKSSNH